MIVEIERLGQLALGGDELHAVFLDKRAAAHLVEHLEPLEHEEGSGMSDSPMWKRGKRSRSNNCTLMTMLSQQVRDCGAAGTAADDNHLTLFRNW